MAVADDVVTHNGQATAFESKWAAAASLTGGERIGAGRSRPPLPDMRSSTAFACLQSQAKAASLDMRMVE
jgi:hypothetical protein